MPGGRDTAAARRPRVGPEGWLAFLEDAGLERTVLYPPSALADGKIVRLDYAVALCRAYEDTLGQAERAGQYDLGKLR